MELHWIVAALLFTVGANAASSHVRIVGGENTAIQSWPFIVQVESSSTGLSWSQFCSANILNNRYVLSAASCFDGRLFSPSRRRLRAGSSRRGSGGVVVGVSRVLNHPNYNSDTKQADLSLVEQTAAWLWSPTIQPIQIPPQGYVLPDDLPVVLAGWGATGDGLFGQTSSNLQEVTVHTVNRDWCAERYLNSSVRAVDEAMVCTGSLEPGRGSCGGDEGGPVYFRDADDVITLIGIISWRGGCADTALPSVNTRVSAYTQWIVINALSAS